MTKKEMRRKQPFIVAVDCDGTLWFKNAKYPACGGPRIFVIEKVKQLKKLGAYIILWTCRADSELVPVRQFCKQHGIIYDAINQNYKRYSGGFAKRKIFAHYYIDDQAMSPEEFLNTKFERLINEHSK
jgi:hydroxymethylpyrimidine pyrophosphatase-like HAD family hydrolase